MELEFEELPRSGQPLESAKCAGGGILQQGTAIQTVAIPEIGGTVSDIRREENGDIIVYFETVSGTASAPAASLQKAPTEAV